MPRDMAFEVVEKCQEQQILEGAHALLSEPSRWCTRAQARDATGVRLHPGTHPDAVQWCALGAIERVAWQLYGVKPAPRRIGSTLEEEPALLRRTIERANQHLSGQFKGYGLHTVNDSILPGGGRLAVLEAFEAAAASYSKEELHHAA